MTLETLVLGVAALWLAAIIPAAVITALKEQWLFFIAGFFTLGAVWLVAAASLAQPDSSWARRFYDEPRLAEATDRERGPRPRRITGATIGSIAASLVVVLLFAAFPSPILGVDGKSLQYSVGGTPFFGSLRPCGKESEGVWTCQRWDRGYSSAVEYRVSVDDFGCWTATRLGDRGEGSPKQLAGCITILDHIRLLDRASGGGGAAAD